MPTYELTLDNGSVYQIDTDRELSQEELLQGFLQSPVSPGEIVKEFSKGIVGGIENLAGGVGSSVRWLGTHLKENPQGLLGRLIKPAVSFASALPTKPLAAPAELALSFLNPFYDDAPHFEKVKKIGERIEELGKTAERFWQEQARTGWATPSPKVLQGSFMDHPWLKASYYIASFVPSLGAAFVTSLATGNPFLGAGMLGLLQGAPVVSEAMEKGVPYRKAGGIGLLSTIGTSILGVFPLEFLIKGGTGKILSSMALSALRGGGAGVLQQIWQNLLAKIGYDKSRQLYEGLLESFIGGAGSGGILGGISAVTVRNLHKIYNEALAKGVTPEELNLVKEQIASVILQEKDTIEETIKAKQPTTASDILQKSLEGETKDTLGTPKPEETIVEPQKPPKPKISIKPLTEFQNLSYEDFVNKIISSKIEELPQPLKDFVNQTLDNLLNEAREAEYQPRTVTHTETGEVVTRPGWSTYPPWLKTLSEKGYTREEVIEILKRLRSGIEKNIKADKLIKEFIVDRLTYGDYGVADFPIPANEIFLQVLRNFNIHLPEISNAVVNMAIDELREVNTLEALKQWREMNPGIWTLEMSDYQREELSKTLKETFQRLRNIYQKEAELNKKAEEKPQIKAVESAPLDKQLELFDLNIQDKDVKDKLNLELQKRGALPPEELEKNINYHLKHIEDLIINEKDLKAFRLHKDELKKWLISASYISMLNKLKTHDPTRAKMFSRMWRSIPGLIQNYYREMNYPFPSLKYLIERYNNAVNSFYAKYGREPYGDEFKSMIRLTKKELEKVAQGKISEEDLKDKIGNKLIQAIKAQPKSLESKVATDEDGNTLTLKEVIGKNPSLYSPISQEAIEIIHSLSPADKEILYNHMMYGLDYEELGQKFNKSPEEIRNTIDNIIKKLPPEDQTTILFFDPDNIRRWQRGEIVIPPQVFNSLAEACARVATYANHTIRESWQDFFILPQKLADVNPQFRELWNLHRTRMELSEWYHTQGQLFLKPFYKLSKASQEKVMKTAIARVVAQQPWLKPHQLEALHFTPAEINGYYALVRATMQLVRNHLEAYKVENGYYSNDISADKKLEIQNWAREQLDWIIKTGYLHLGRAPVYTNPWILEMTKATPEEMELFPHMSKEEQAEHLRTKHFRYHFPTRLAMLEARDKLIKQGWKVEFAGNYHDYKVRLMDLDWVRKRMDLTTFKEIVKELGIDKSEDIRKIEDYLRTAHLPPYLMQRYFVPGYEYFTPSDYISALDHQLEISARIRADAYFDHLAPSVFNAITDENVKRYALRWLEAIKHAPHDDFNGIRVFMYANALSLKFSWLIENASQDIWNHAQAVKDAGYLKGTWYWLKAEPWYLKYSNYLLKHKDFPKHLPGIPDDVLNFVIEGEKRGLGREGLTRLILGEHYRRAGLLDALGFFSRITERRNRLKALFTIAQILKDKYKTIPEWDKVASYTRSFLSNTQVLYGKGELPIMLQRHPFLQLPYAFMFTMHNLFQTYMRSILGTFTAPPGQKLGYFRQFLTLFGWNWFFGGLFASTPLWSWWRRLYRAKYKRELENDILEASREILGKNLGDLVVKGAVNTITGEDLSRLIGFADFPLGYGRTALDNLLENFRQFYRLGVEEGDWYRASMKLSPLFLNYAMQALLWIKEGGVRTPSGRMIYHPTKYDIFMRMLGFMPDALSERYRQEEYITYLTNKLKETKYRFVNRLVKAHLSNNPVEREQVFKDINEWNRRIAATQPYLIINPYQIHDLFIAKLKEIQSESLIRRTIPKQLRPYATELEREFLRK